MDFEQYLSKIDRLVAFMSDKGLQSLSAKIDGFDVQLSFYGAAPKKPVVVDVDETSLPAKSVFDDTDGAGVCVCGHSWVEHTEAGCLHACSHELCTSNITNVQV